MGLLGLRRGFCAVAILLGLSVPAVAVEVTPAQVANRKCAECHDLSDIGERTPVERRSMVAPATQPVVGPLKRPGLRVNEATLAKSMHVNLACVDCHPAAKTLPHPQVQGPASCDGGEKGCHSGQRSDYIQGAHREAAVKGIPGAPTCSTCHGTHDIRAHTDRQSHTFPLNIVKICGDCHQQHGLSDGKNGKEHIQKYMESVHGRAVVRGGLAVAATCADCHGPHKTLPSKDPKATVNRANIAQTCGRCHTGISEVFATSIHAATAGNSRVKTPVCSDCHTSHAITRTDTPAFKADIVAECGDCHKKEIDTYRASYHGQVTKLGYQRAARCSSCHGSHAVTKVEAPGSRLAADRRIQTCSTGNGEADQCHGNAPAGFVSFYAHADYRDGKKYPLLNAIFWYFVIMMSFAFGFFGLHSLLWFIRSIIERIKHGPHPKLHGGPSIQRFNKVDRVNHGLVIVSFFGLTITGLPLLYADKPWGESLMRTLGGVYQAGILHRFFAIMLIGNFVVHGVGLIRRIRKYGFFKLLFGPTTMLPRLKDVKDCFGMIRWFFVGGKKPPFDRWTYWEKFDYTAEVGGSVIIGVTGLMLWFPGFFGQYLPGWIFNAATIVHGYEALLAIGFIFSIHFFNAHLRMEKFPVDDVMFTGRLPEEEFKEERAVEYERLAASGELEALRVPPAKKSYRIFAVIMGLTAMAIGTTLVVLIILAGLDVI